MISQTIFVLFKKTFVARLLKDTLVYLLVNPLQDQIRKTQDVVSFGNTDICCSLFPIIIKLKIGKLAISVINVLHVF